MCSVYLRKTDAPTITECDVITTRHPEAGSQCGFLHTVVHGARVQKLPIPWMGGRNISVAMVPG